MKKTTDSIFTIIKKSYQLFASHNPLLLSSATAFFTAFAISPIIIILGHILSWIFGGEIILPKLFTKIGAIVGGKTSQDIKDIVFNFMAFEKQFWVTIAITVFFYFVATTLLSAIRQSIHQIWDIRKKRDSKFLYSVKERLIEIGIVLLIGALFSISVGIDNVLTSLGGLPADGNNTFGGILVGGLNIFFSVIIISSWFFILFKFLPEAHVHWKVALAGSLVTGILFNLGKLLLNKVLVHGKLQVIFGHSSSIALLLLFIFYCSFVMYFGAAFTFEVGKAIRKSIRPGKLANEYKRQVVEEGK